MELDQDGVFEAINSLSLFHRGGHDSLDGISYRVSFGTIDLSGTLEFGNPTRHDLATLERALLFVAETMARHANIEELRDSVSEWRSCVDGRRDGGQLSSP
jgi:hypothetical protein